MKNIFYLILLLLAFSSCVDKQKSDRYLKISEADKMNPKWNKKYDVFSDQKIVVILDSEKDEFIYYDVWEEKILERVSIKELK